MAYKVIILYRLYMPSYVLGTFTEYPSENMYKKISCPLQKNLKSGQLFAFCCIQNSSTPPSHLIINLGKKPIRLRLRFLPQ